ncbi:hypothetical protein Psch_01346 [Pelotomaculum schinkii]|uniref:Uncharacterized protein n=1 Tax=Pelotomaculum schinkii TaxID=78350 RepID=A0A4Y7RG87_9FIRM|nr:hypothetical protein Psch_01346 [Pelotomaculum schinkii]TEB16034.1 hypothetical protein Psfp_01632 [Pelotomaculum sp. FP]
MDVLYDDAWEQSNLHAKGDGQSHLLRFSSFSNCNGFHETTSKISVIAPGQSPDGKIPASHRRGG